MTSEGTGLKPLIKIFLVPFPLITKWISEIYLFKFNTFFIIIKWTKTIFNRNVNVPRR